MKKIRLTGRSYIFIFVLAFLGVAVCALLFLKPATPSGIKAGDEIVVRITAARVSDLYGYQFALYYDKENFEYVGGVSSSLDEIRTIFAKEFDSYLLVGATKIGNEKGFSGKQTDICEITLIALKDCDPPVISISGVNIVQSDLNYLEDVTDWTYNI